MKYQVASVSQTANVNLQVGMNVVKQDLTVPTTSVNLWWPNGYGDRNMYDLNVTLSLPDGTDTISKSIGFRDLQIITEPVPNDVNRFFLSQSVSNIFFFF